MRRLLSKLTGITYLEQSLPEFRLPRVKDLKELGTGCVAFSTFSNTLSSTFIKGGIDKCRDALICLDPFLVPASKDGIAYVGKLLAFQTCEP